MRFERSLDSWPSRRGPLLSGESQHRTEGWRLIALVAVIVGVVAALVLELAVFIGGSPSSSGGPTPIAFSGAAKTVNPGSPGCRQTLGEVCFGAAFMLLHGTSLSEIGFNVTNETSPLSPYAPPVAMGSGASAFG